MKSFFSLVCSTVLTLLLTFNVTFSPYLLTQKLAPPAQGFQVIQPLAQSEGKVVLRQIFSQLTGYGILPVVAPLLEKGFFDLYNPSSGYLSLEQIFDGMKRIENRDEVKEEEKIQKNVGYLRVAMRLLVSHGWISQKTKQQVADEQLEKGEQRKILKDGETKVYDLTDDGENGINNLYLNYWFYLNRAIRFFPVAENMDQLLFNSKELSDPEEALWQFRELVGFSKKRWKKNLELDFIQTKDRAIYDEQMRTYLDGLLIGPVMVALARKINFKSKEFQKTGLIELSKLKGNSEALNLAIELLKTQGWIAHPKGDLVRFSAKGKYAAKIAHAYGVTVSYLPTFRLIPDFLFGDPKEIPRRDKNGKELLVNRPMNVWASGAAHDNYFKKMDKIIIDLFNKPLEDQPIGVIDMGCGDASLLRHIYEVIKTKTLRGEQMKTHPLLIIGADFNQQARLASNITLNGIPYSYVLQGNINSPDLLQKEIARLQQSVNKQLRKDKLKKSKRKNYLKNLSTENFLHVRSFLDHNRPDGRQEDYEKGTRVPTTSGAFAYRGAEVTPAELEENLVQFLKNWTPHVGRFGLIALELHTLPPDLIAANLGRTLAIPYDATHGFSDQYLVEVDVWLSLAREAGLIPDENFLFKIPRGELSTISLTRFYNPDNENGFGLFTLQASGNELLLEQAI